MYMCYKTYILQMYWFQVITRDKGIYHPRVMIENKNYETIELRSFGQKVLNIKR